MKLARQPRPDKKHADYRALDQHVAFELRKRSAKVQ